MASYHFFGSVTLMHRLGRLIASAALLAVTAALSGAPAAAQTVPGAADSGRFEPSERLPPVKVPEPPPRIPTDKVVPVLTAPPGSDTIQLTLRELVLRDATKADALNLRELYAPFIGQVVSLEQVYGIAAQITQRYREAGYVLSYAYIPDQEIAEGNIIIAVVEGYIGRVVVEGRDPNDSITQDYIARITSERPTRERSLESSLLRLNDLPGYSYRAVLSKDANAPKAELLLTLIPMDKSARATLGFDNFSSRYTGPHEMIASYSDSLLPRQQTNVVALASLPLDRLQYGSLTHGVVVAPDVTLEAAVSFTHSKPAYTLSSLAIDSATRNLGASINYQLIRQRNENLLLKLGGQSRHAATDVFNGSTLSRDDIRMVYASASFDRVDRWQGSSQLTAVITKGIQGFGSSEEGDANLSRSQAEPDFTKLELSASRLQTLGGGWSVLLQASGQLSSAPLYASEEYGFGGQTFGRAYDASEIVGDEGAAAMAELRFTGWRALQPINIEPFIFYDAGFVTNMDVGQTAREGLSSAGMGVRFATTAGPAGMVGVALPLTREANAPIYGSDASVPRFMLQIAHNF